MTYSSLAASLLLASTVSLSALTLIQDGKPQAKIYVSQESLNAPHSPLKEAIEDLNVHFEKMSGTRLEVVPAASPKDVKSPAIVLDTLAAQLGAKPDADSVRLLSNKQHLLISGDKPSLTANGIYIFLNSLGCEWVMPGEIGEIIPVRKTVSIADADVREKPAFQGRNLWYRGGKKLNTDQDIADFRLWRMRQRMDADRETPNLGAGHVWDALIKRNKEAFEKDPTMLALVRDKDGNLVREGPQVESTHPGVVDLFVKEIENAFAKNKWPKDHAVAFGIGPADGLGYSLSTETAQASAGRIDPLTGNPDMTDVCVLLANTILDRIEKEYPNVSLGYYSYSVHADYPSRYKPHPHLNQIFAPINFSRFHSPLAENSKTWPYYVHVVDQWSALAKEQGNQLSYRGYNWNLAENMVPYSKLRIYGEEIPWYHKKGFMAVNIEATKAWAVNGPSDFLLAKLLWNASLDWKAVLKDYCRLSFGDGADEMEAYFLDLTDQQQNAGQEAGSYHALHLIFNQDFVKRNQARIQKAISLAKKPEEKTRAGYFQWPLEQLGLYLQFRDAFTQFDFAKAKELFKEIHTSFDKAYAENSEIVAKEVPQYLKRYFAQFVEKSEKYSTAPYRIVAPLPDELLTQFDPTGSGEIMGFQNPHLNDTLFLKTRTWSAPWDAQGLGALRSGAVWYRFHFETPEDLQNGMLGLFVGGVEDQVDVWLNGDLMGKSPRGFSLPFVFDLTKGLKKKGENVLTLKISRMSAINEIGLGGMIRPAFLFTGPALDEPVQDKGPQERILPGGETAPAKG